jgi:predicted nucleic acid-binding protein
MRWLIDSDVLIEGERGNPLFTPWLEAQAEVATADIVRAEFLIGVYAVSDPAKRQRGELFYRNQVANLASLSFEPADFETGARMAGEARRNGKGGPSLVDGLLAAVAIRSGATVATKNVSDFKSMGCPCFNPLEHPAGQPAT